MNLYPRILNILFFVLTGFNIANANNENKKVNNHFSWDSSFAVPKLNQIKIKAEVLDQNQQSLNKTFTKTSFLKKNPVTRLGQNYLELVGSILSLHTIHQKNYWENLSNAANESLSTTLSLPIDTVNDLAVVDMQEKWQELNMKQNNEILQCTSQLPIPPGIAQNYIGGLGGLSQLKHTWLQIDDKTYGMPFTLSRTYFGGPSFITSPDGFIHMPLKNVRCEPVFQPKNEPAETFAQRLKCISEKMAVHTDQVWLNTWGFDYHALKNNCHSAVRFLVECAGGRLSQWPNLGVGSEFDDQFQPIFYSRPQVWLKDYQNVFVILDSIDQAAGKNYSSIDSFFLKNEHIFLKLKKTLKEIEDNRKIFFKKHSQENSDQKIFMTVWLNNWEDNFSKIRSYKDLLESLTDIIHWTQLESPVGQSYPLHSACQKIKDECEKY